LGAPCTPALLERETVDTRTRIVEFEGIQWTVREQLAHPDNVPSLVFVGEKVARRIREYPENWYTLTALELAVVSKHR
jgi:hypothetical protein